MPVKAKFGFGEDVCWRDVNSVLREGIARSPKSKQAAAMKWITRSNIKVDRVACPWLIRRFIDPKAEFFFVPEGQLLETAGRIGATPFDANLIPEVTLNHRGERCTFEAIL